MVLNMKNTYFSIESTAILKLNCHNIIQHYFQIYFVWYLERNISASRFKDNFKRAYQLLYIKLWN